MGFRYETIVKLLDVPKTVPVKVYDPRQIKSVSNSNFNPSMDK